MKPHCLSTFLGFLLLSILSNELTASGVTSPDVSAVFNTEEWKLIQPDTSDSSRRPPKATNTWRDPEAEIFVSIVEYRDSRCPLTLKNLFTKAQNPNRIYIGKYSALSIAVCQQILINPLILSLNSPPRFNTANPYRERCYNMLEGILRYNESSFKRRRMSTLLPDQIY
jgi:Glycosyltransferase (GlcNAc)